MKCAIAFFLLLATIGCTTMTFIESRKDPNYQGRLKKLWIITQQPWMDADKSAFERADLLLARMTTDQKIAMCHGAWGLYTGNVPGIKSLHVPALHMSDGPQGARIGRAGSVTCFPSPVVLASTWDIELAYDYGVVYGAEQKGKGTNVTLAPMMNLARVPHAGRNWEGFGEDPYLSAMMAAAEVKGIQSNGIIACAKHYIGNEQETNRGGTSIIDDRTLHEIYLLPFKKCVEADVGSIMGAYNKVNWRYSCENPYVLATVLYEQLGFTGFVVSDWGATHSTIASANSGLSMEMPGGAFFGDSLADAVKKGEVPEILLNTMVKRILVPMFKAGLFDRQATGNRAAKVTSVHHTSMARDIATKGLVLLKNTDNALPLSPSIRRIALIGEVAHTSPVVCGGGSGRVPYDSSQLVTAFEGISNRAGRGIIVNYDDGFLEGRTISVARNSDVAIVVVGLGSSEVFDRCSLSLPHRQGQRLIERVAAVKKTIVVVFSPAQVLLPWIDNKNIAAVLWSGLPGQEQGNALAGVLFGDINPSGKLPITFAANASDYLPPRPECGNSIEYSEKLLIGYRGFDSRNIAPLYPFGHGLSYTAFYYSDLTAASDSVSFTLKNVGKIAGAEVAQLYLGFPPMAEEPPKQLKGFKKLMLEPGASQRVTINLSVSDLSVWDAMAKEWTVCIGTYKVYIGSSSRDIRLIGTFSIGDDISTLKSGL